MLLTYCPYSLGAPGSTIPLRFLFYSFATWWPKWLPSFRSPCSAGTFNLDIPLHSLFSSVPSSYPGFSESSHPQPYMPISCCRCFYPWWTHSCRWSTLAPCHQPRLLPRPLFLCYLWAQLCSLPVWLCGLHHLLLLLGCCLHLPGPFPLAWGEQR